jgi:NAD(P)-dependent dehydrogenase (short-subunit alcohol dehydrogenase family)
MDDELKARRIRVNAVSPGPIETPLFDKAGVTRENIDQFVATMPMGRVGTPDEVAKAAVFLASDDSSYITGTELFVDGGGAQVQALRASSHESNPDRGVR